MEIVVAALAVGLDERRSAQGDTLIRSACDMLAHTSPEFATAATVSLPADGPAEIGWLRARACSLAPKYELDAAVVVEDGHITIRFTRREVCGGQL